MDYIMQHTRIKNPKHSNAAPAGEQCEAQKHQTYRFSSKLEIICHRQDKRVHLSNWLSLFCVSIHSLRSLSLILPSIRPSLIRFSRFIAVNFTWSYLAWLETKMDGRSWQLNRRSLQSSSMTWQTACVRYCVQSGFSLLFFLSSSPLCSWRSLTQPILCVSKTTGFATNRTTIFPKNIDSMPLYSVTVFGMLASEIRYPQQDIFRSPYACVSAGEREQAIEFGKPNRFCVLMYPLHNTPWLGKIIDFSVAITRNIEAWHTATRSVVSSFPASSLWTHPLYYLRAKFVRLSRYVSAGGVSLCSRLNCSRCRKRKPSNDCAVKTQNSHDDDNRLETRADTAIWIGGENGRMGARNNQIREMFPY